MLPELSFLRSRALCSPAIAHLWPLTTARGAARAPSASTARLPRRRAANVWRLAILTLGLSLSAACGSDQPTTESASPGTPASQADAGDACALASCTTPPSSTSSRPPAQGCGDGRVSSAEACDDGDQKSGDGCTANCLAVEPGYACPPMGGACRAIARCGDGVLAATEPCDDENRVDGDGCSASCKLEIGFRCQGEPSKCTPTTCGDGKREGAESCDDGNALPFDGCSATCQSEPKCQTGQPCSSACGDGLVLNEECDDGNQIEGDGCSAQCKLEPGFRCTTDTSCTMVNGSCVLRVAVIFRDFNESHSDFGIGCGQLTLGVVQDTLNEQGKPVLKDGSAVCIESASSYAEWYTSNQDDATIPGELVLYQDGKGGFVNRYGPNGEQWLGPPGPQQAAYDGNPLFFPIDDSPLALNDTRWAATIPEQYGYNGWPAEDTVVPGAHLHNFHFTTEVVYWFRYDAATAATLDFLGDDDLWVFVNGKLAVDLGGPHVPESGSVTLDAQAATRFGLRAGAVHEIHVFHAERKVSGSSFKLTLRNFNTTRSECVAICGDGIVTAGEECDDGVNDGGYEQCAPGCVLGASCGDGIVQEGEDCDDGNRADGDGCGSACRNLVLL